MNRKHKYGSLMSYEDLRDVLEFWSRKWSSFWSIAWNLDVFSSTLDLNEIKTYIGHICLRSIDFMVIFMELTAWVKGSHNVREVPLTFLDWVSQGESWWVGIGLSGISRCDQGFDTTWESASWFWAVNFDVDRWLLTWFEFWINILFLEGRLRVYLMWMDRRYWAPV